MADANHLFGSDLVVGPTGDIAASVGTTLGQQRVLRRLLTNPGDYIWQPGYGAGLAQFVGNPADAARIRGVIRSQIFRESVVARSPDPQVVVEPGRSGEVYLSISYVDAQSSETQVLSFSVGGSL